MRTLLTIALIGLLALSASADVTLRSVYFTPSSGDISLYVAEDEFHRKVPVLISSLSEEQRSAVQTALTWLGAQLPAGFASVDRVILEPGLQVPTAWDEDGNAVAWSRSLSAAVTGSGPKGQRTISIADAPAEIRSGLLALWDSLEASLNP